MFSSRALRHISDSGSVAVVVVSPVKGISSFGLLVSVVESDRLLSFVVPVLSWWFLLKGVPVLVCRFRPSFDFSFSHISLSVCLRFTLFMSYFLNASSTLLRKASLSVQKLTPLINCEFTITRAEITF
jgi:hypothetical protein